MSTWVEGLPFQLRWKKDRCEEEIILTKGVGDTFCALKFQMSGNYLSGEIRLKVGCSLSGNCFGIAISLWNCYLKAVVY